jgi:hypothetical protein
MENKGYDNIKQSLFLGNTNQRFSYLMNEHIISYEEFYKKLGKKFKKEKEINEHKQISENSSNFATKDKKMLENSSKIIKGFLHNQKKSNKNSFEKMNIGLINASETLEAEEKNNLIFIIKHDSCYRIMWDIIIFSCLLYTAILTPLYLSLFESLSVFKDLEMVLEIIFIIEFISNFFTTFTDKEENVITERREIILNYLFSWFLYDLLFIFPIEILSGYLPKDFIIIMPSDIFNLRITFFKWFKLYRIGRIYKVQTNGRFLDKIIFNDNKLLDRVLKFIIIFFIISHIASCYFIYISLTSLNSNNWISIIGYNNNEYFDIYLASLYFVQVTVYSIGYGDITPINIVERMCVCIFMIVGSLVYSFAISSISTIFNENNNKISQYKHQQRLLRELDLEHDIQAQLYQKIKQAIKEANFNRDKERYKFLSSLPSNLRKELSVKMYKSVLNNHNFFRYQKTEFALQVLPLFSFRRIRKEDVLFSVGEKTQEMYLILKGKLGVHLENEFNNMEIWEISKNQYFGDLFLQLNYQSPYELKCKSSMAEILVLKKNDFHKLKRIFNNNMINILENSLYELKRIEERKILIKHLFRFCGKISLVKKKIKQLRAYCLNQELMSYFNNNLNINKHHNFIFKDNVEEVIELLYTLDDPHFIKFGKKDPLFINKEVYEDYNSKREMVEVGKCIENGKNNFIHENKSLLDIKLKDLSVKEPDDKRLYVDENIKKEYDLNLDVKSFRNSQTYSNNNASQELLKNLTSQNFSKENVERPRKISRFKTNKSLRRRNGLNSDYSLYYNKLRENVDGLTDVHHKSEKERCLNRKTLKLMNSSQSLIKVDNYKEKESYNNIRQLSPMKNERKRQKNNLNFSSNFKKSKFKIDNPEKVNLINTLKIDHLRGKAKLKSFTHLKDISVENFTIISNNNNNNSNINPENQTETRDFNETSYKKNSNTIVNESILKINNYSKDYGKKYTNYSVKDVIFLDNKLDKILYILYEYKNIQLEKSSRKVSFSENESI